MLIDRLATTFQSLFHRGWHIEKETLFLFVGHICSVTASLPVLDIPCLFCAFVAVRHSCIYTV